MPQTAIGHGEEVLTLAEAAQFLRVSETELLRLVESQDIPTQQIGGEWRFLKRALVDWLRFGRDYYRKWSWTFAHPMLEDLLFLLEERLLQKLKAEKPFPEPGSKQTVLRQFGVFKDEMDLDAVLAAIHARRKAAGG